MNHEEHERGPSARSAAGRGYGLTETAEGKTRKTALYDKHVEAGGRMVPFAGWWMPVQYRSIMEEHRRVRSTVGLFDVSHMGEFEVRGRGAAKVVNRWITNDAGNLKVGDVLYSAMCYEDGGIVDDLLVYRLEDGFLLVVNAANEAKDFEWIREHMAPDAELVNNSRNTTLVALQGPKAEDVITEVGTGPFRDLGFYRWCRAEVAGVKCLVSRTGYTGEDGFEVYLDWDDGPAVWDALMEAGRPLDIEPVGLGARDTLRLEVRYCLYGNDIDKTTTPLEASLGWAVKLDKDDFIGKGALAQQKAEGLKRKLVGFEVEGRGIPRPGHLLLVNGSEVGRVTSGSFGPSTGKGIGMGYVDKGASSVGQELMIQAEGKSGIGATIVRGPFYKQGSRK